MGKRPRVPNYKVQAQQRKQKAISNLIELYEDLSPKEVVKAFNKCEEKAMQTVQYLNFVRNVKENSSGIQAHS